MEETEEGGFGLYATWISNADGKELGFSRPGNDGYKMLFLHNTFKLLKRGIDLIVEEGFVSK